MNIRDTVGHSLFWAVLAVLTTSASAGGDLGPEQYGAIGKSAGDAGRISRSLNSAAVVGTATDPLGSYNYANTLGNVTPEPRLSVRGAKEANLYRRASQSVVLVVTSGGGLGSGSLVSKNGEILTNWHVIRDAEQVGVIFKPKVEGQAPTKADVRRARVVKVDEVADLALLKVDQVPAGTEVLALGSPGDAVVGADVHAIGHPTGEAWTYTKGVVSQVRQGYKWSSRESGKAHQANVIQTQTPINPGNSGGPLLTDEGKLVGVNSFKSEGEGLNFAVAVDEVKRFLTSPEGRVAKTLEGSQKSASRTCEPKTLFEGMSRDGTTELLTMDINCDGTADAELRVPTDPKKPVTIVFDRNQDSKPDIIVFDEDRDTKWDLSLHDNNYDGKWDLVGYHPDGDLVASRFERYDVAMTRR